MIDRENAKVRLAAATDAKVVATLVYELLAELSGDPGSGSELSEFEQLAGQLLIPGSGIWGLLAERPGGEILGVLMLNQCASFYAGGPFGEVTEFYVSPGQRGTGVGKLLMAAAVNFARERAWQRLEVGAPPTPQWQSTVDFYLRSGFVHVGPRLKLLLT